MLVGCTPFHRQNLLLSHSTTGCIHILACVLAFQVRRVSVMARKHARKHFQAGGRRFSLECRGDLAFWDVSKSSAND